MTSCETCKHVSTFTPPGEVVSVNCCRRYPPQAIPTNQGLVSYFPPVSPQMTCGEWQQKEVIQ